MSAVSPNSRFELLLQNSVSALGGEECQSIKTAQVWLSQQKRLKHNIDYRFDVIAIQGDENNIDWIQNAITQG